MKNTRRRLNKGRVAVLVGALVLLVGTVGTILASNVNKETKVYDIPAKYESFLEDTSNEVLGAILEHTKDEYEDITLAIIKHRTNFHRFHDCEYGSGLICMRPTTVKYYQEELGYFQNGRLSGERFEEMVKISVLHIEKVIERSSSLEEAIEYICGNEDGNEVQNVMEIYNSLN